MKLSGVDWVPLMAIAGGGVVGAFAFGSLLMHRHADVVVIHEVTVEAPLRVTDVRVKRVQEINRDADVVSGGEVTWSPDGRWLAWAPTEPARDSRTDLWLRSSPTPDPEPLIYVDGIRVGGRGYIDNLDPSAIERIEIIKGNAATELFGREAAGGVIQIFLKEVEAGEDQGHGNDSR